MKSISTLLSFITIILLSSCSTQSYMLADKDMGYNGENVSAKPVSNFRTVSNKPAGALANADGKWIAASNPHVVATSSRVARVDAVALSAATTVEGHEILKREIEKAMKTNKATPKQATDKKKTKKPKKNTGTENNLLL